RPSSSPARWDSRICMPTATAYSASNGSASVAVSVPAASAAAKSSSSSTKPVRSDHGRGTRAHWRASATGAEASRREGGIGGAGGHLDEESVMPNSAPPVLPPLIDNPLAPEFFADEATGFFIHPRQFEHHVLLGLIIAPTLARLACRCRPSG